ncbi:MAG: hypothetical protein H6573_32190 [Lewinellaceae bacterium]|nr:hypothetical protein [Lewinellaceae bacterium]
MTNNFVPGALGRYGRYWSASEYDADGAWFCAFNGGDERADRYVTLKSVTMSCRCLKDLPSNGID